MRALLPHVHCLQDMQVVFNASSPLYGQPDACKFVYALPCTAIPCARRNLKACDYCRHKAASRQRPAL